MTTTTTATTTTEAPTTTTTPPTPEIGQWVPAGRPVAGQPAVWVTLQIPPGGMIPVGVARLDTTRLRVVLYAGTTQPGGTWPHQAAVPPDLRPDLVAAFNGGFQFPAAGGGFEAGGRQDPALTANTASLVTYADGHAQVAMWGRDATLTPDITGVRQNLTLLVDGGSPTPEAQDPSRWGTTLTHSASTWRSAIGSDARQDLIYVAGPDLTPLQLAETEAAAGAQRAMELDINPQWALFASYADQQPEGTALLPSMHYPPDHFFAPDWRDFIAVFSGVA